MSGITLAVASFAVLTLVIYTGIHISTALFLVAIGGIWLLQGDLATAIKLMGLTAGDAISDYDYGVIPLFVLMGLLVMQAGVGSDSYAVAHQLFRKVPGGLGHATVVGNAIFSAITGVSVAAVVLFTRLAVPEMVARGYDKRFAVGVVAGSAMLGMLIPPSVLMILYAILTDVSIGSLFLAGIVPGVLLSAAFCGAILFLALRHPERYGGRWGGEDVPLTVGQLLGKSVPIVLLVAAVLGGMYAGVFTATEAGAVGATAALVLALVRRCLTWRIAWQLLVDTGHVTASLIIIIIAASVYSRFLAMTGLPGAIEAWMQSAQFGLHAVLAVYVLVVLLLGTALDSTSTTLIAVPIFTVAFKALGADLVWIGIITMITVEIGLITPPLGMAPFVIKMTLQDRSISLDDIYAGALPFAAAAFIVVLLVIAFPILALGLVR